MKNNEKELERKIQEEGEVTLLRDFAKALLVPGYTLYFLGTMDEETKSPHDKNPHKINTQYILACGIEVMKGLMYFAAYKGISDLF